MKGVNLQPVTRATFQSCATFARYPSKVHYTDGEGLSLVQSFAKKKKKKVF